MTVSCRFDYCNTLYVGLPSCDIAQLESVQNATIRLFGSVSKYDSVTSVLCDVLHWLPIKERINFKIGILTYKALNGLAPSYLSEMLVPVAVNQALRRNRSADRCDWTVPQAKNTSYGDDSFAIAVPMLWNGFLVELCCSPSKTIFYKSYLFMAGYNIVSPPIDWSWLYHVKHPEVLAYGGSYINSIIIIIWDICVTIVYSRHILSGTLGTSRKTRPRNPPSNYASMPSQERRQLLTEGVHIVARAITGWNGWEMIKDSMLSNDWIKTLNGRIRWFDVSVPNQENDDNGVDYDNDVL